MKKIYIILLLAILVNCGDEEPLTPTTVKNWYVITPTENMDEVDTKIYEIYQRHKIAVFYKDTIGSEDRGYTDTLGNPILYYKVIDLNYNMTQHSYPMEWENIDISSPLSKNNMLPLLEMIDKKLLPMLEGSEVYVPAIFLAQNMKQVIDYYGTENIFYIRKAFDILGLSLDGYEEMGDQEFCLEFLKVSAAGTIAKYSDEFYDYVVKELEFRGLPYTDPWGWPYGNLDNSPESYKLMGHWVALYVIEHNKKVIEELNEELKNEDLTEEEIQNKQDKIIRLIKENEAYSEKIMSDSDYEFYMRLYGYYHYGFIGIFGSAELPTKEQDLSMYMELVLFTEENEVMQLYAEYPIIINRYQTIKKIFEETGFDIKKVGEILKQ